VHVEGAALLRDHGVKEDLQQDVAKFLLDQRVLADPDGLVQLCGLLDEVWPQGVVSLGGIPLAAGAEIAHECERIFKCSLGLHSLPGSGYTTRP